MSKKQKTYPAEFKTKIVLELLSGDQTVSQIASKYSLISKSILNWKKVFLANASLAFNADAASSDRHSAPYPNEFLITQEAEINKLLLSTDGFLYIISEYYVFGILYNGCI